MKLLALSGRRQSGKGSLVGFLVRNSRLFFGKHVYTNVLGSPTLTRIDEVSVHVLPFAVPIKEFTINYLGVPREWAYGDNQAKENLTDIFWESLPHYERLCEQTRERVIGELAEETPPYELKFIQLYDAIVPRGRMTVRQLLEEVGEAMFLSMNPRVWTDFFKREVQRLPDNAVVLNDDLRKPEQVDCVRELGGKVIRLPRCPYPGDTSRAETALDQDVYDWGKFNYVLRNARQTLRQSEEDLYDILLTWGYINKLTSAQKSTIVWANEE